MPQPQSADLSVADLSVNFKTAPADSWVSVTPDSGMTPQVISVSVDPIGLAPGRHESSIQIDAPDSATPTYREPVTLDVKSKLTPDQQTLSFTAPAGINLGRVGRLRLHSILAGLTVAVEANPDTGSTWLGLEGGQGTAPGDFPVTLDTTGMTPGNYHGSIRVTAENSVPASLTVPVYLTVTGIPTPGLRASPPGLFYPADPDTNTAISTVQIFNAGATAFAFDVTTSVDSSPNWLLVTPSDGSATASEPAVLQVAVTPGELPAGTYTERVILTAKDGSQALSIPVSLVISSEGSRLVTSQTGMTFRTAEGVSGLLRGSFDVLQRGDIGGTVKWTINKSTLAGGDWLTVSPTSGTSRNGYVGTPLTVTADAAGLTPGTYYGQLSVHSDDAINPDIPLTIVFQILERPERVDPVVEPAGLVFVKGANAVPDPQTVNITNNSASSVPFNASVISSSQVMYHVEPAIGQINAGQSLPLTVTADLTGVSPGLYRDELELSFGDKAFRRVRLSAAVAPAAVADASSGRSAGAVCSATELLPTFTLLGSGFSTTAGWPTPLEVRVVDDCGESLTNGSVTVDFSNGDPSVHMLSLGGGRWAGTWTGHNDRLGVLLTARAWGPDGTPKGLEQISGDLTKNAEAPAIVHGYIVNSASSEPAVPLGNGSLVTIYGTNLAVDTTQATSLPMPAKLGETEVVIEGRTVPLGLASPNQVNGMLPFGLRDNLLHYMVLRRGSMLSVPEAIAIVDANPGVFTLDGSGTGAAVVIAARPDGSQFLVTPSMAAHAGDVLVIYCTGLGAVNPPLVEGQPAPLDSLSITTLGTTVAVGGVEAPVQFAGLAPGYAGLYQVNSVVPTGVTPGTQVPLRVTTSGKTSLSVTIAIE